MKILLDRYFQEVPSRTGQIIDFHSNGQAMHIYSISSMKLLVQIPYDLEVSHSTSFSCSCRVTLDWVDDQCPYLSMFFQGMRGSCGQIGYSATLQLPCPMGSKPGTVLKYFTHSCCRWLSWLPLLDSYSSNTEWKHIIQWFLKPNVGCYANLFVLRKDVV